MSAELENCSYVILIQNLDFADRFSPCICPFPSKCGCPLNICEKENIYTVLQSDDGINGGKQIFEFKEKSNYLSRLIFLPSIRNCELFGLDFYEQEIIEIKKPLKCPILCFGRPEFHIKYRKNHIGRIIEPFIYKKLGCVLAEIHILDKNNSIYYVVKGSCFQFGAWCFCGENMCKKIRFRILNKNDEEIGFINHVYRDFLTEYCSKADKYSIYFPEFATVEEKILIISCAILIDYILFENV